MESVDEVYEIMEIYNIDVFDDNMWHNEQSI